MQIRINLDQIFGGSTREDTDIHSQYNSYEASDAGSRATSNNPYRLSLPIFDDQAQETPQPKTKTPHSKTPSVTSIQTEFSVKAPGERLYYESKNNITRKTHELERLKLEKMREEEKESTFRPKINPNSEKILTRKGKQPVHEKKEAIKAIPTYVLKQQEEVMKCTFKPQLVSKSNSGMLKTRPKKQAFEDLFNDHKLKQVKQKMKSGESEREREKKLSKADFENFLARNNEFINKVEKKKEIILSTSSKFDLETGHKMFSPKTNTFKSHKNYFEKNGQSKPVDAIITKPIFSKNYDDIQEPSTQFVLARTNNQENSEEKEVFLQINEAKQDQQQEEIAVEQQIYQTVKGFQFESDQQAPKINDQTEEEGSQEITHQQKQEDEDEDEGPAGDDKSEEGQTHHEGQQSRCQQQQ